MSDTSIPDRIRGECKGKQLTTYGLFEKMYRETHNGARRDGALLRKDAEKFDRFSEYPAYVGTYFGNLDRASRTMPQAAIRTFQY